MAITAAERTEIMELVVLMFNAAPGATYLDIIVDLYEANGHDLQNLAIQLAGSSPYVGLNPSFQTASEFATAFLTPLGLQADAFAIDFITSKFNAGASKGQIAYEAYLALNTVTAGYPAQYVNAKAILDNKVEVALYYSVTKGVVETDLADLQLVLSGVTADPATVTSTKTAIDNGTLGVDGIEATLTTAQNIIVGTSGNDNVYGIFGGADATYTTGDDINLGDGAFDRLNLTATAVAVTPANTVKNTEFINIEDTVGATFNALLVENTPAITFTNTSVGVTSTVTNGQLASVMGIAGKGNLTVDYASTSGAADKANVSLAGVGTSATVRSLIDIGDTNTVESVSIATSGTNFITLNAGTAAGTVTVTGSGTNTLNVGTIKSTATIDASTSTGTNTFNLGTTLSNGDVVKGGTGADTVDFNATVALGAVTFTGVETAKADIDADISVNLGTSTGLKTLTLAGSSGSLTVSNATAELTTVNITSTAAADVDNDFGLGYATDVTGTPTLNIGGAAAIDMNDFSFTRVGSLTVNTVGTFANDIGEVDFFSSPLVDLTINVGAGGILSGSGFDNDAGGFGAIALTVGASGALSLDGEDGDGVSASAGGIDSITMTIGSGGSGDVSFDVSGTPGSAGEQPASGSSVGNVSLTIASGGQGYVEVSGSSGNVGDVAMTITGNDASGYIDVYAAAFSAASAYTSGGNIGNITVSQTGASGSAYVSADANSGDIGNITFSIDGSGSYGEIDIRAREWQSGSAGGPTGSIGDVNVSVLGSGATLSGYSGWWWWAGSGVSMIDASGDVGDVSFTLDGDNASGRLEVSGSGDGGNLAYTVNGSDASGEFSAYMGSGGSALTGVGDWGTVTVSIGDDVASAYIDVDASGSIGDATITIGDNVGSSGSAGATVSANANDGDVGNVTATMGSGSDLSGYFSAGSGSMGSVTVTAGADSSIDIDVRGGISTGAVSVTAGVDSSVSVDSRGSSMGAITITGGSAGDSGYAYASGGAIDGINMGGWLGNYTIDASGITGAAVLTGGADGGTIYATDEADVVTGGAGNDNLYASGGADVINAGAGDDYISGGLGADAIDGGAGTDTVNYDDASAAVTVNLLTGAVTGADGNDMVTAVENVNGSIYGDTLTGNASANVLLGNGGADTFTGGAGKDTMTGGSAVDTFVFSDVDADTDVVLTASTDVVASFTTAVDKLDFTVAGTVTNYAEVLVAAADLAAFSAAANAALNGTVVYYFGVVGANGYLAQDVDGTGITTIVQLNGVVDMAFGDII